MCGLAGVGVWTSWGASVIDLLEFCVRCILTHPDDCSLPMYMQYKCVYAVVFVGYWGHGGFH